MKNQKNQHEDLARRKLKRSELNFWGDNIPEGWRDEAQELIITVSIHMEQNGLMLVKNVKK
jgi:hypothetical protein